MGHPGLLGQLEGFESTPNPDMGSVASQGREGDTELAHVNPQEKALLEALGGSGTINPMTGLREYHWHPASGHWGIHASVPNIGRIWNTWIGNEGLGGWLADRTGIHGKPKWMGGEGMYLGSGPGPDDTWDASVKGKGEMLKSLKDLKKVWKVGQRDYDITKGFQAEKQDAFHKDSLMKYLPQKKTQEWTQGSKGTGVKFGSGTNMPDISEQYKTEKESGMLAVREDNWKQQQSFAGSQFDIQTAGRNIYNNWLNSITSPKFKAQVQSWDDITEDMPWLQGGSTTTSYS